MEDKPDNIVCIEFIAGQSFMISPKNDDIGGDIEVLYSQPYDRPAWPPKKMRLPRKKKKKLKK